MKKRILFINGHLNTGGIERSLVDILEHMDFTKYAVDLLLLEDTGDYISELPDEVHVLFRDIHNTFGSVVSSLKRCIISHDWMCLQLRILFLLKKFRGARALKPVATILLGKHHYDSVIGFRSGICSDLAAYSVRADKRITWWHHGEFKVRYEEYRDMCDQMDAIVVVSRSCMQMLKSEMPEITNKLIYIPNMLDVYKIKQKVANSPYTDDILHIVSVGRLVPEKHFENIIFAAKKLQGIGANFKWHIIGEGTERTKLESQIFTCGLVDYVVLEGSKVNPYPYIKYADLFVHPSYVESQGLTILEAMALGIPCVVTKSRGSCELIKNRVNGLLTEQSPESLDENVQTILRDKLLYKQIQKNTRYPEQFKPEQIMKKIEALI